MCGVASTVCVECRWRENRGRWETRQDGHVDCDGHVFILYFSFPLCHMASFFFPSESWGKGPQNTRDHPDFFLFTINNFLIFRRSSLPLLAFSSSDSSIGYSIPGILPTFQPFLPPFLLFYFSNFLPSFIAVQLVISFLSPSIFFFTISLQHGKRKTRPATEW